MNHLDLLPTAGTTGLGWWRVSSLEAARWRGW